MRKDIGLYRGKRKDNGEWVEGAYYKQTHYYGDPCERHYIITSTESLDYDQVLEYYEVIPETVGQYTGVNATQGKKIFENDIIKCTRIYDIGCYPTFKTEIHEVVYAEGCFTPLYDCERNSFEVIGNHFDNPELL